MPVPRMVSDALVTDWLEMGFQVQPTKFSKTTTMEPTLVERSSTRTWEMDSGIFQRMKFHCITNNLEYIGLETK